MKSALSLLMLSILLADCDTAQSSSDAATAQLSDLHSVSTTGTQTYLGMVPGIDAFLGIVVFGTQARAYVCDGTPTRLATLAEWFAGPVINGAYTVTTADQVHLEVRLSAQRASDTLAMGNEHILPITLAFVANTPQTGVYEGTTLLHGTRYHAGWIVLPAIRQHVAASAFAGHGAQTFIVIGLYPFSKTYPTRTSLVRVWFLLRHRCRERKRPRSYSDSTGVNFR